MISVGLFFLLKRVCTIVITARKESFGIPTESYSKSARKAAKLIRVLCFFLWIYPIYQVITSFIYQRNECGNEKKLGLIIASFSRTKDDDFSYKLFNKIESELQATDTISIIRSDEFITAGQPFYMDSIKALFPQNCITHGLLLFGKRSEESKLFDCNIFINNLQHLCVRPDHITNKNMIYLENPDLINFSIEAQASVVSEFVLGLLSYNNEDFSKSREQFNHSLGLNVNNDNKKFISNCYFFIGNNLFQEKHFSDAASAYRKGILADSSNSYLHFNLANSLLAMSDTIGARNEYNAAQQSNGALKNPIPSPSILDSSDSYKTPQIASMSDKTLKAKKNQNIPTGSSNNTPSKNLQNVDTTKHMSDFHLIKANGKYGLANSHGQVIIKCEYDSIYKKEFIYKGKSYIIAMKESKFGAIDCNGNTEIPFNHPSAERVIGVIRILVDYSGSAN